jgi:hypothetical protein
VRIPASQLGDLVTVHGPPQQMRLLNAWRAQKLLKAFGQYLTIL